MGQVLQGTIRLNDAATNTLKKVNAETTRLLNNFNKLNGSMNNVGKNKSIQRFESGLRSSNNNINRMNRGLSDTSTRAASLVRHYERSNTRVREMAETITRTSQREEVLNARVRQLESELSQATAGQNRFNRSVNSGNNSANRLLRTIGSLVTTYIGLYSIKKGMDMTDDYININARLANINDGLRTQRELQLDIFAAAQRSRGVYKEMASTTAKLGLLAPDAFKNNDELIYFVETLQKAFKVSGASTQESTNAMYQLTQAMASGRLQGDEFRSIIENAPMLANAIAEYTGVGMKGLKDLSSKGAISADIIKNSLYMAADDINAKFNTMPKTFSDIWNQISGTANMTFAPLFEKVNLMLNDSFNNGALSGVAEFLSGVSTNIGIIINKISYFAQDAQPMFSIIKSGFSEIGRSIFSANGLVSTLINTMTKLARNTSIQKSFATMSKLASMVVQSVSGIIRSFGNLMGSSKYLANGILTATIAFTAFKTINSVFLPIAHSVGTALFVMHNKTVLFTAATESATIAQRGLNAALKANPYMFVAGAIMTVVSAMGALIFSIKAVNKAAGLAQDSMNVGGYSKEAWDLHEKYGYSLSTSQSLIDNQKSQEDFEAEQRKIIAENQAKMAGAYKNIDNEILVAKSAGVNYGNESATRDAIKYNQAIYNEAKKNIEDANQRIADSTKLHVKNNDYILESEKQYSAINKELDDLANSVTGNNIPEISAIKDNTDKMADSIELSTEYLDLMKDVAEREAINKFTTVPLSIDARSTNNVSSNMDLDSMLVYIQGKLLEGINTAAEGVHF